MATFASRTAHGTFRGRAGADAGRAAPAPHEPPPDVELEPPFKPPPVVGLGRRQLAFAIGVVIVVWIVLVFARAVATSSAASARADQLRLETAARTARLRSEQAELITIQTPAFVRLEARAYGIGQPGERPFALNLGAPAPSAVVPLGAAPAAARPPTPLDAWLTLLFGR